MATCYDPNAVASNPELSVVRQALEELLGYLAREKLRYGMLTFLERTYFSSSREAATPLSGTSIPAADAEQQQRDAGDDPMKEAETEVEEGDSPHLLRLLKLADVAYSPHQCLGSGATASVLRGMIGDSPAAIKFIGLFKVENGESLVRAEITAYSLLAELQGLASVALSKAGIGPGRELLLAVEEISPGSVDGAEERGDLTSEDQNLARAALQFVHSKGFIHGDLRLDNLPFDKSDGARRALWISLARSRPASAAEIVEEMEELEWIC
ncbi:hypothetical protein BDK51DRAFT_28053 [Blyttiomyces helicus]|uniref:Protein kinase domain-containing protein n=1 Tax=Blyttiomyces helicus TaxID=388810 RepID=A0A4P9VYI9_9FUNG|nr:hypothetical protein BDK51DRAFT_28053 [Blyttiomyces helicus]|eukprot:RKO84851.1 hypothetical protein BDK51DRAFT_28053 [Blyttiomyces helicus]